MTPRESHERDADSIPRVPTLRTSDDPLGLAASLLREAIASVDRERVRVAISGGSALRVWLRAELPWDRIHLTWVDERCVDHGDSASNRGETHRGRAERAAHELPLWLDDEDVDSALSRIRAGLRDDFDDRLDVTLLGMGGDGHIASLFPGRSWEGDRVLHVPDSPKPPAQRMTLSHAMIATASTHVLYAVGDSKTEAVERVMAGDPELPASTLDGLVIVRG